MSADPTGAYAPRTHDNTNIDLIRSDALKQKAAATTEHQHILDATMKQAANVKREKDERERVGEPGSVGRTVKVWMIIPCVLQ